MRVAGGGFACNFCRTNVQRRRLRDSGTARTTQGSGDEATERRRLRSINTLTVSTETKDIAMDDISAFTDPAAYSFIRSMRPLLIDGQWSAGSDPAVAVTNPSNGQELLSLGQASAAEVDAAVAAARAALEQPSWARMTAVARAGLMFRLADLVERDAEIIAQLETLSAGIPITLARNMALPLSISILRYYAGWVTKLHGETIPAAPGAAGGAPVLAYTRREPIGVVAQIIPWNFPLGSALLKIAPALATGCTVVLKPSELTPVTALYLAKLALEGRVPERRTERRQRLRCERRGGPCRASGRRQDLVHGFDRGRPRDPDRRGRQSEKGFARARRQVAGHHLRRCRPGAGDSGCGDGRFLPSGTKLHGGDAPVRSAQGA